MQNHSIFICIDRKIVFLRKWMHTTETEIWVRSMGRELIYEVEVEGF